MWAFYQERRFRDDKCYLESLWYDSYCDAIGNNIKTHQGYYT